MTPSPGWTIVLWAGIAVLIAAAGVAGFLWLPYSEPAKETPWEIEILPGPQLAEATAEERPNAKFGWVDRQQRIVRIPIEEAMALAAKRLSAQALSQETPTKKTQSGETLPQESLPGGSRPEFLPRRQAIPTDAGSGRYSRPPATPKANDR